MVARSPGIRVERRALAVLEIYYYTNRLSRLEFPEFLVNTVVPERHSWKRWGTPEGEQEGESPAFRAGKGQAFLTCEPREGHRESIGAKGQWCALVKNISHCKANKLRRSLAENSGNP
ncbi:MAG: hypothetical protein JSW12_14540 [Deltaproteobacteria bacterium]|nr:MAG: hypothetical protein JSW12_14540 [Deltaproteobacteria bacterium]